MLPSGSNPADRPLQQVPRCCGLESVSDPLPCWTHRHTGWCRRLQREKPRNWTDADWDLRLVHPEPARFPPYWTVVDDGAESWTAVNVVSEAMALDRVYPKIRSLLLWVSVMLRRSGIITSAGVRLLVGRQCLGLTDNSLGLGQDTVFKLDCLRCWRFCIAVLLGGISVLVTRTASAGCSF